MNSKQDLRLLTADELVERWNGLVDKGTLANWRSRKKGPPFIKFGHKIAYPMTQLEEWELSNLHQSKVNDNA